MKRKRPGFTPNNPPPCREGSQLQGFSKQSRSRLKFTAENAASLHRCAQFVGTYADVWPVDGREFKRQLNLFLTRLRKAIPFLEYLWVGEFQTRGAPHFHLFLNIEANEENRLLLGSIWHEIAGYRSEYHRWWHCDRVEKNGYSALIPWNLNTVYVCKYLEKQYQKAIPDGFRNFGRWWGNSRGLVAKPDIFTKEEIQAEFPQVDEETGEINEVDAWQFLMRTVGRYHERKSHRSWFRKTSRSTSVLTGAPIFNQALNYLRKGKTNDEESPF